MACDPDTEKNLERAAERVADAAKGGATLICLPELFRAQYFCQREDHALFDVAGVHSRAEHRAAWAQWHASTRSS